MHHSRCTCPAVHHSVCMHHSRPFPLPSSFLPSSLYITTLTYTHLLQPIFFLLFISHPLFTDGVSLFSFYILSSMYVGTSFKECSSFKIHKTLSSFISRDRGRERERWRERERERENEKYRKVFEPQANCCRTYRGV